MTIANLAPTYTDPTHLADAVKSHGFGVLSPSGLASFLDYPLSVLDELKESLIKSRTISIHNVRSEDRTNGLER